MAAHRVQARGNSGCSPGERAPGPLSLRSSSLSFPARSLPLSARPPADVNVALRKIANLLKPDKEIVQDGDHMIIRTLSTFRNYIMDFQVGKEFEEDLTGIDDRKCMVRISCPGVGLTKAWAHSFERIARALVFLGTRDLGLVPQVGSTLHPASCSVQTGWL